MTREQAVKFLLEHPAKFGAMIGFDKLTDLHNKWIIEMVRGDGDKRGGDQWLKNSPRK